MKDKLDALELFIDYVRLLYSIQEEIKSRLKLGNACYYSVQNLLSSGLLSKKLKIKIYRTTVIPRLTSDSSNEFFS